jgi:hypothetical protein
MTQEDLMNTDGRHDPVETLQCPACGISNPSWRSTCEHCGANLSNDSTIPSGYARDRPGCVTAYAILLWVGAAFMVVAAVFGWNSGTDLVLVSILLIFLAIYNSIMAIGLWRLRNWGRIMAIVLFGLGIVVNLLTLFTRNFQSIIGLAVGSLFLYWFITNGDVFE